jgi:hypothetical protein
MNFMNERKTSFSNFLKAIGGMCLIFVAGMVQVWEVATGRCLKTWSVGGVVKSVAWCPNSALSLVAVAVDTKVQTN